MRLRLELLPPLLRLPLPLLLQHLRLILHPRRPLRLPLLPLTASRHLQLAELQQTPA